MNKIFFFLSLLLGFLGIGNSQPVQTLGNPNNIVVAQGMFGANKGIVIRTSYADTTAANADSFLKLQAGIHIRTGDIEWQRSADLSHWFRSGAGAVIVDTSTTVLLRGDGSPPNPLEAVVIISQQTGNALVSATDGLFVQERIVNGLNSGGILTWVSGYTYDVSAAFYAIGGVEYEAPETQVTLANADPTLDRIDVVVANTNGTITVITGTPATNPQEPSVDVTTQLPLNFVYVTANTIEPVIPQDWIYENYVTNSWTTVSSSARIVVNSTNNPYSVPLDIEGTLAQNGDNVRFTTINSLDISDFNILTLKIFSKSVWVNTSKITLQWYDASVTATGLPVSIANNAYSFQSSQTTSYQTLSIPVVDFQSLVNPTSLLMTVTTLSGATIGFYIDDIQLQSSEIPTFGNFHAQGGNVFGQNSVVGTNDNYALTFIANNTEGMRIGTTGNVLIGTTTDNAHKIRVNGTAWIDNTLTVADQAIPAHSTIAVGMAINKSQGALLGLNIQNRNTSNSAGITFSDAAGSLASMIHSRATNTMTITGGSNLGGALVGGLTLTPGFSGILTVRSAFLGGDLVTVNALNREIRLTGDVLVNENFAPVNLAADYTSFGVTPTYNQTGALFGSLYGIRYTPVLTSVLGAHWGLYIESGKNYIADEVLVGSVTDNGDYKLQVTGGVRLDVTSKTLRWVGVSTDNTATQVAAKDASGNTVWRDVSSISSGASPTLQNVITNGSSLSATVVITSSTNAPVQWQDASQYLFINQAGRYIDITSTKIAMLGALDFNSYGTGANTGTPTYALAVTSAGDVIEVALGSGMTNPMTSTGDIIYSSNGSGTPARLGIGTTGQVLQVSAGGIVEWVTPGVGGSVTSVGLTSSDITVGGTASPITTSGTFTLTLATVNSNVGTFGSATQAGTFTVNGKGLITAASNVTITPAASSITGGAALTKVDDTNVTLTLGGTPSASLLAATSLTLGWTGNLATTRGGTGITTYTTGDILYASATNVLSKLTIGTAGQLLAVSGGIPAWVAPSAAGVASAQGTANQVLVNGTSGSAQTGAIIFTLPQNINTTASVRFNNLDLGAASSAGTIGLLVGTSTTNSGIYNNANITPNPAGPAGYIYYSQGTINEAASGNHSSFAGMLLVAPTVNAGAATVTYTATLDVSGPMTATTTVGNYAVRVQDGTVRIDDLAGAGKYITADANGVLTLGFNRTVQTLTDGATITWNVSNGGNAIVTLAGTGRTLSVTSPVAGETYIIRIIQGSGGSKTITTWPTGTRWPGGTAPTLSTTAGDMDIITLFYDGSNYYGIANTDFS